MTGDSKDRAADPLEQVYLSSSKPPDLLGAYPHLPDLSMSGAFVIGSLASRSCHSECGSKTGIRGVNTTAIRGYLIRDRAEHVVTERIDAGPA